ncbi:MAG: acyl carrier protein [Deltaproteobacteria bacterium]|nr:MAG: acyl carrier protein [Deltaproteobacteria bacterium]
MDEVLGEIGRVLREELGMQREVRPGDELLRDLQLDSVGLLTLVVDLEDHFRVALKEEDAAVVRTVAELAALVLRRREEAAAC